MPLSNKPGSLLGPPLPPPPPPPQPAAAVSPYNLETVEGRRAIVQAHFTAILRRQSDPEAAENAAEITDALFGPQEQPAQ